MEKNAISSTISACPFGPGCQRYHPKLRGMLAVSDSGVLLQHYCAGILIFKTRAILGAALANIKDEAADTRHDRS